MSAFGGKADIMQTCGNVLTSDPIQRPKLVAIVTLAPSSECALA